MRERGCMGNIKPPAPLRFMAIIIIDIEFEDEDDEGDFPRFKSLRSRSSNAVKEEETGLIVLPPSDKEASMSENTCCDECRARTKEMHQK
jgi:hypothetical protein